MPRRLLASPVPFMLLLPLAALAMFTLAAPADAAEEAEAAGSRPNIVFILADDMGYGDAGAFNENSKCPTPNIDRLAQQGMKFTDAHSPGSWCVPTRYGFLTGRHPFRTNRRWKQEPMIEADRVTLPGLLRKAGYHTAMVGKWHLGFEGGNDFDYSTALRGGPVDRGFDRFFGMHASLDIPPYFYIEGRHAAPAPTETAKASDSTGEVWNRIQGRFWRKGKIAPNFEFEDVLPTFTDKAAEYLASRKGEDEPFFLYLALPAPHTPWVPLERFQGTSGAGMYGDFVAQVDHTVGRVLKALEKAGKKENTLVVFTSDNGPVWYDKDVERFGHDSAAGFRGMKGDAWEAGHRMPFIVRWPGVVQPGSSSDHLFNFTDMMATFAETAGQNLPEGAGADSFSILPALTGKSDVPARPAMVVGSIRFPAIRAGKWKLIKGLGSGGFSKPRRIKPKKNGPKGQLYNMARDPGEQNNLWKQHPDVVKRLTETLQRYRKQGHSRPMD